MIRSIISSIVSLCLLLAVAAPALAQPGRSATAPKPTPAVIGNNGLVPLKIIYPRPGFMSAGNMIMIPPGMVVDKSSLGGHGPKPFYAPPGTTNVALHKPVTCSAPRTNLDDVAQITDGQKASYEGDVVELLGGRQWVQIDLQASYHIYGIMIWHSPVDTRIYRDVVAQVSNDPEFKRDVTTVYNNDQRDETGHGKGKDLPYVETYRGKLIDTKGPHHQGLKARYVRLYSNGVAVTNSGGANDYTEVEVYGLLHQPPHLPVKAASPQHNDLTEIPIQVSLRQFHVYHARPAAGNANAARANPAPPLLCAPWHHESRAGQAG